MMDTISKHQSSPIALARSGSAKTRRYYRREEKLRIVEESFAPGASVSVVARKHDVNANIVFAWRRQFKRGQLAARSRRSEPALLPILIGADAKDAGENQVPTSSAGHIEIHLADGRWIHVSGLVESNTLRTVLAELMRT
jgi:transposase